MLALVLVAPGREAGGAVGRGGTIGVTGGAGLMLLGARLVREVSVDYAAYHGAIDVGTQDELKSGGGGSAKAYRLLPSY